MYLASAMRLVDHRFFFKVSFWAEYTVELLYYNQAKSRRSCRYSYP